MQYKTNNNNYYRLNDRLNHVETQVSSIDAKVENVQNDVNRLVQSFDNFSASTGKTNWSSLAAWVAIAISMVSALLYHSSLTLEPGKVTDHYQQEQITKLQSEIEGLKVQYASIGPSL